MTDITEIDRKIAARSAETICRTLSEFIAPCCREVAQSCLLEALLASGIELTARAMRRDYEALKSAAPAGS